MPLVTVIKLSDDAVFSSHRDVWLVAEYKPGSRSVGTFRHFAQHVPTERVLLYHEYYLQNVPAGTFCDAMKQRSKFTC